MKQFHLQVKAYPHETNKLHRFCNFVLKGDNPRYVFWLDKSRGRQSKLSIALVPAGCQACVLGVGFPRNETSDSKVDPFAPVADGRAPGVSIWPWDKFSGSRNLRVTPYSRLSQAEGGGGTLGRGQEGGQGEELQRHGRNAHRQGLVLNITFLAHER